MLRLALSFAAAAFIATGALSAFGSAITPPQLQVIGHVYARAHHNAVSATPAQAGALPGQFLF